MKYITKLFVRNATRILVTGFIFCAGNATAGIEKSSSRLDFNSTGAPGPGTILTSNQDGKLTDMIATGCSGGNDKKFPGTGGTGYYNKSVKTSLFFGVDPNDALYKPIAYSLELDVSITYTTFDCGGAHTFTINNKCVQVEYNPSGMHMSTIVDEFPDAYAITVTLNNVTCRPNGVPYSFYVESVVETERYYDFSLTQLVTFGTPTYSSTDGELELIWTKLPMAEMYDLEWVYIDNYRLVGGPIAAANISFTEDDFRLNSTRVTISDGTYKIPVLYGQGYIVYRVRCLGKAAGDGYTELVAGAWTSSGCTSTCNKVSHFNNFPLGITEAHEEYLNWQASMSFAEEGKSKAVVNYFDGSLRNRQSVTKSKTDNTTLAAETIYDHQGRPAIQVLPVPTDITKIKYNPLFSREDISTTKAYDRYSFDLDGSVSCTNNTIGMSLASGASKYYSGSHTFSGAYNDPEKYLPDALKYPFTQTVFTPDNTGRVKAQSGVGNAHKIGSGKETKYFYGVPHPEELDRLFGYEAGVAAHYKKNMVQDANGQLSISYIDQNGKVVATSLAGAGTSNTADLPSKTVRTGFTVDLLKKLKSTDRKGSANNIDYMSRSRNMSASILVSDEDVRNFAYYIEGAKSSYTCENNTVICYHCVLDLAISLTDDCGNEYLGGIGSNNSTETILGMGVLNGMREGNGYNPKVNCTDPNLHITKAYDANTGDKFSTTENWFTHLNATPTTQQALKVGNYHISKQLKVNQEALDLYTKDFLNTNTCLKSYDDFYDEEHAKVNFDGCEPITCQSCRDRIAPRSKYQLNPGYSDCYPYPCLSDDEYDLLLKDCDKYCDNNSVRCNALYTTLLADVSRGGQYGQVSADNQLVNGAVPGANDNGFSTTGKSADIDPSQFPLSVFNEANFLPIKYDFPFLRYPNWRFPFDGKDNAYKEANGTTSYIVVTMSDKKLNPAVHPSFLNELIPMPDGTFLIKPQYLLDVKDFLARWKPSWAQALLRYHPEYGYYEQCQKLDAIGSNIFDEQWISMNMYSDAIDLGSYGQIGNYGYFCLNPLGTTITNGSDPYFNTTTNTYLTNTEITIARNMMLNAMDHYAQDDNNNYISIWDMAQRIANCPNDGITCANTSCALAGATVAQFGNFTFGTGTNNADDTWRVFRSLYISLKQRVMELHSLVRSINGGYYNGCIGNDKFNPAQYGFSNSPSAFSPNTSVYPYSALYNTPPWNYVPLRGSQYNNFEQPCNWSRSYLYAQKMARAPGVTAGTKMKGYDKIDFAKYLDAVNTSNTSANLTDLIGPENDRSHEIVDEAGGIADISLYKQCGKCPMALDLEMLMGALNRTKTSNNIKDLVSSSSVNISCSPYTALTKELMNEFGASPGSLSWSAATSLNGTSNRWELSGQFAFTDGNNTNQTCDLSLKFPDGSSAWYDFDDILDLCCIEYDHSTTPINKGFTLRAVVAIHPSDPDYYDSGDPNQPATKELVLHGNSCIDIANCTFKPTCELTATGRDFFNLLKSLFNYTESGQSSNTLINVGHEVELRLEDMDDPGAEINMPVVESVLPNLRYQLDKSISAGKVNLFEYYYWKPLAITTLGNGDKKLTVHVSARASGSARHNTQAGGCLMELILPSGYNYSDITEILDMRPDPSQSADGFILKVKVVISGTASVIELSGIAPCFMQVGTCFTDVANAYRTDGKEPQKLYCSPSGDALRLLALLNDRDAFDPKTSNGQISYSTDCDGCKCSGLDPDLTQFDVIAAERLFGEMNGFPQADPTKIFTVTLTNQVANAGWAYEFHVDCAPVGTPFPLKYCVACTQSDFVMENCQLIWRFSYPGADGVYNGSADEYVEDMPLCDCDKKSTGSNTSDTCQITSGSGCMASLEFPPVPGYTYKNIVSFRNILPDPDRPAPRGYFTIEAIMDDGNVIPMKGYTSCGNMGSCKPCSFDELAEEGDFSTQSMNGAATDYSSSFSCGGNGVYTVDASAPSACGGPLRGTEHTYDGTGSSHMLIIKTSSTPTIKKAWSKTFTVIPHRDYVFRAYYMNCSTAVSSQNNYPKLLAAFNGKYMAERLVSYESDITWKEIMIPWNSGDATSLVIDLKIDEVSDLSWVGIDDISLGLSCPCGFGNYVQNGDFTDGNHKVELSGTMQPLQFVKDIYPLTPSNNYPALATIPYTPPQLTGEYNIQNKATGISSSDWHDHTRAGEGRFMLFKLAQNSGTYTAWRQIVTVDPQKEYTFSAWTISSLADALKVEFYIDGQLVRQVSNGHYVDTWLTHQAYWKSGMKRKVEFMIKVQNLSTNDPIYAALDDISVIKTCNPRICRSPRFTTHAVTHPCEDELLKIVTRNAKIRYEEYIKNIVKEFQENYIRQCLDVYEDFFMKYDDTEHHFTLYYYDQAGNLVRTIPPEGVQLITGNDLKQVKEDRANKQRTVYTGHTYATTYKYNSLNQLVAQQVPDQDDLNIWEATDRTGPTGTGIDPSDDFINATAFSGEEGIAVGKEDVSSEGAIFLTGNAGKTWEPFTGSIKTGDVKDMIELSTGDAFAVTADGKLLVSADGGMTWNMKSIPTTKELVQLHFSDATKGQVYAADGSIWVTTDAGDNWTALTAMTLSSGASLTSVHITGDKGVAVSSMGHRLYTTNKGVSWTAASGLHTLALNKIQFVNSDLGFAAGKAGTLIKTNNGGQSWQELATGITTDIKDIYMGSQASAMGCLIDQSGKIYFSTDHGSTWNLSDANSSLVFIDLHFLNSKIGYALTNARRICVTHDGGLSWSKGVVAATSTSILNCIYFVSNTKGFAAGKDGEIWETDDAGATWTDRTSIVTWTGASLPNILQMELFPTNGGADLWGNLIAVKSGVHSGQKSIYTVKYTDWGKPSNFAPAPTRSIDATLKDFGGTEPEFESLQMLSEKQGYAVATNGSLAECAASGSFIGWTAVVAASGSNAMHTQFALASGSYVRVFAAGDEGELFKITQTVGSALSGPWTVQTAKVNSLPLHGVHTIVDPSSSTNVLAYACGDDGTLLYSANAGVDWKTVATATTRSLNSVYQASSSLTYVAGESGYIAKLNSGTWVNESPAAATPHLRAIVLNPAGTSGYAVGDNVMLNYASGTWSTVSLGSGNHELLCTEREPGSAPAVYVAGGKDGELWYTQQGTVAWTKARIKAYELYDMEMAGSGTNGFAVGKNGIILHTPDKGQTWYAQVSALNTDLTSVSLLDEANGFVVGKNGKALRTRNGGITWEDVSPSGAGDLNDVQVVNRNLVVMAGNVVSASPRVYYNRTPFAAAMGSYTQPGFSGTGTGTPLNTNDLYALHFTDEKHGYMVGANNLLLNIVTGYGTSNFSNWTATIPTTAITSLSGWGGTQDFSDVYFHDYLTGYASTANGFLVKTVNGGASWEMKNSNGTTAVADLTVLDQNNLFISGGHGAHAVVQVYDMSNEFSTRFYYDQLGRMVSSQNAKQYNVSSHRYSYTQYDALGRTTEVGQLDQTTAVEELYTDAGGRLNQSSFDTWVGGSTRQQVTHTFYDENIFSLSPASVPGSGTYLSSGQYTFEPRNLRKRVASVSYEENHDGNDQTYDHILHYTYDLHGNVGSLLSFAKDPFNNNTLTRQLDYIYDLVSGNVNEVHFQPYKTDQFRHRYFYDADNRITEMQTSDNGIIWQSDARYNYYRHGPLARTELGNDNVQGMDYAYTIQGWLKGVNSNSLMYTVRDMGKDGHTPTSGTNLHQNFARDEMGFSLGYFDNDYTAIGFSSPCGSPADYFLACMPSSSELGTRNVSLYNGNISHMVTAIRQFMLGSNTNAQAMVYGYDQLNRIATSDRVNTLDIVNNTWQTGSSNTDYHEAYTYDANGNIMSLVRNGVNIASVSSNQLDNLTYKYETVANGYTKNTNRLRAVNDNVPAANTQGLDDVKYGTNWNQDHPESDMFQYDELGNLAKDGQEEIANIEWTVYGKIRSVTRRPGSSKADLEFGYDPMGQRLYKIAKYRDKQGNLTAQSLWRYTYYSRDAQGNVMATYTRQGGLTNDQPEVDAYYLYGSSRVGEYKPGQYNLACGEQLDVNNFTSWNDVANWSQTYLERLGYDPGNYVIQTWVPYWNNLTGPYSNFGELDKQALHHFIYEWMRWMCQARCMYHDIENNGGVFTNFWDAEWTQRLNDIQSNNFLKGYDYLAYVPMQKTWQLRATLLFNNMQNTYTCDDCQGQYRYAKGSRQFELGNHLGNVLVTVSDRKIAFDEAYDYVGAGGAYICLNATYQTGGAVGDYNLVGGSLDGQVSHFLAEVRTAQDYYPFGMIMPDRSYTQQQRYVKKTICVACTTYQGLLSSYSGSLTDLNAMAQYFNTTLTDKLTGPEILEGLRHCGLLKESLNLNGSTDYVDFGVNSAHAMGSSDFSVEAWVKLDGNNIPYRTIVSRMDRTGSYNQGYDFYIENNNSLMLFLAHQQSSGTNYVIVGATFSGNLNDGNWHHVVAQRIGNDGTNFKFYVDGTLQTTNINYNNNLTVSDFDQNVANSATLNMGVLNFNGSASGYFGGELKQVRIYKRQMSAGEITANYQNTCAWEPTNFSNLVFWSPLNEGSGTQASEKMQSGIGNLIASANLQRVVNTTPTCSQISHCIQRFEVDRGGYRFGFNGMERDDDYAGDGNSYDFGARIYNSRLGKWLSVDPLQYNYYGWSPYNFTLNNPIVFIDGDGKVVIGSDGNPVTYSRGKDGNIVWSENATSDIVEIGNAMMQTKIGEAAFNRWQNAKTEIILIYDTEHNPSDRLGETDPQLGVFTGEPLINEDGNYVAATVTVFKKAIEEAITDPESRFYGADYNEALGAVATHEEGHNDPRQILEEALNPYAEETEMDVTKNIPINREVEYREEYHQNCPGGNNNWRKKYDAKGYKGTDPKKYEKDPGINLIEPDPNAMGGLGEMLETCEE